jgi:hypothetical protein
VKGGERRVAAGLIPAVGATPPLVTSFPNAAKRPIGNPEAARCAARRRRRPQREAGHAFSSLLVDGVIGESDVSLPSTTTRKCGDDR